VRTWRYLVADEVGSAEGLATDEAITASYSRASGGRPPTVRLYTYRSHCALVGRYQHLEAELRLDECVRRGVEVNRRPTGGGAIVMGAGQLGVAICAPAPAEKRPRELLEQFSGGIVAGLARLGIAAEFRGKNDLAVNGRKIAGLGLYLNGSGGLLFHASVLADLDIPFMLSVLDVPAAKLGDRAVTAVGERVTTATRETSQQWDGARLRPVVAAGLSEVLGVDLEPGDLDQSERDLTSRLVEDRYSSEAWKREYSPRSDATATATVRLGVGTCRVYLALHGRTVKSVLFTGDFNSVPAPLVQIEEQLRWKRLDRGLVGEVVRRCLAGHSELGDPEAVIAALSEAAERAAEPSESAPDRSGSCYFPEVVNAR